MKLNRITFILIIWLGCLQITHAANQLPAPFKIIPQPQKVELLRGKGLGYRDLSRLEVTGDFKRPVMGDILSRLREEEGQGEGRGKGKLVLKLDYPGDTPESEEGYILTISNGNVEITSRGEAGLFYGCQTLEQLLEDARDFGKTIPACRITDSPALSYRAVHFDVKHHLDHMHYYYESIDRLARYKINAIIFEFEDKLRYRRQPLVGAPQAISIDEMAALTKYASERNIEISPLVQGLGHATFILKHQQYAHLREVESNRWAFCPLHEGTYQVLFDLYRDAMEATPGSRYLHIGGDEIGNIGLCPHCKPTADKEGLFALNLYWLKRVCEFVEANGRIPIFWDDMPLKYAGLIESAGSKSTMGEKEALELWGKGESVLDELADQYPKKCVYMRWNYSLASQPGNAMALDWYRRKGLKTMIATAIQSGHASLVPFDDTGEKITDRGVVAIRSFIRLAAENGVDGMLCTAWDDRSPHLETAWRGFIASAEYSWSPDARTLDEYDKAYFQREYGPGTGQFTWIYHQLRQSVHFWEGAYTREGTRLDHENAMLDLPGIAHWQKEPSEASIQSRADYEKKLIGLPGLSGHNGNPPQPGKWTRENDQRLQQAKENAEIYEALARDIGTMQKNSVHNRYHWEILGAINDFQVTAAHMLLALQATDVSDKAQQKAGLQQVQAALAEFDKAWNSLQKTYSKTRFLSNPPDFVPDRYFHFASQREDLSYLIQAEEFYHEMIWEWMEENKQ